MRKMYHFDNVDCAHCAQKIKEEILKIDGVKDCVLNFLARKMILEFDIKDKNRILNRIDDVAKEIVPEFSLSDWQLYCPIS